MSGEERSALSEPLTGEVVYHQGETIGPHIRLGSDGFPVRLSTDVEDWTLSQIRKAEQEIVENMRSNIEQRIRDAFK